jgi:hypothetical protein
MWRFRSFAMTVVTTKISESGRLTMERARAVARRIVTEKAGASVDDFLKDRRRATDPAAHDA